MRHTNRRKVIFLITLCLLTGTFLAGCATKPVVTPKASLDYGRFVLKEAPTDIDLEALRGRRIVIDPGHGGAFPGAVGPNNLREADVNLGVGLYLWGMLKEAGADVYLTRVADSVVYKGEDLDLKKDLHARAEIAKELDADLFVSLHHNADVSPDAKKNSLETYFKLSDPGPSLDVARSIHRRLAISFEQKDNVILPGNFHVLRENPTTAVLGEPSYITHERNAFRLGLAPMQRIEAQAYFFGIAEYFAKGVPKIEGLEENGEVSENPRPTLTAKIITDQGIEIDPASVEMSIDGAPVSVEFDQESGMIRHMPAKRLSNGPHKIRVSLRNTKGNASRPAEYEIKIAAPPAYVLVDSNFRTIRPDCIQPVRLRARVFDADLTPVADGTPVEFKTSSGAISTRVSLTRNGEAITYLTPARSAKPEYIEVTAKVAGLTHDLRLGIDDDAPEFVVATFVDVNTGLWVDGVRASIKGEPVGHGDFNGFFAATTNAIHGRPVTFSREGYEPQWSVGLTSSEIFSIGLKPIADGALFGQRFALDPQYGGEEKGATGPTGVRASDLNFDVANSLARFLRASGAEVVLTREADETVSPLRRVEIAEGFGAQWFISIGHGSRSSKNSSAEKSNEEKASDPVRVLHYPGSENGRRLAISIGTTLEERSISQNVIFGPGNAYVLTHTSGFAVSVMGPKPTTPELETRLLDPRALREEAYALYCGILENFGLNKNNTGGLSVWIVDDQGAAIPGAIATLDGAVTLQADAEGRVVFSRVTPGAHLIEVFAGGKNIWSGKIPVEAGFEMPAKVSPSGLLTGPAAAPPDMIFVG